MKKRCFHCFLFLITYQQVISQPSLLFKTYSFQQGLSSYHIYKTIQDNYGFIWVATQDGLFRFNGHSFELIKNNTGSINTTMGNVFIDLAKGYDNQILAADYFYGIDYIDAGTWQVNYLGSSNSPKKKLLPNYWIEKIYVDESKNLWVGGSGYLAFKRLKDSVFTVINTIPALQAELKINCINTISPGIVAVSINNFGIVYYNTNGLKQVGYQKNIAANDIYMHKDTVYIINNNTILKGIFKNNILSIIFRYRVPLLNGKVTNSIVHDNKNRLWMGTNNGLLCYDFFTGTTAMYNADKTKPNWLKDNMINHLMIDNQDNLWISGYNVLQQLTLRENGFRVFDGNKTGSDLMNHIYTITPKTDNELFCTATDGLYITNIENGTVKRIPTTSELGLVHHIEHITTNDWIVSADKGMLLYDETAHKISKEKLLVRFPEWLPFKNNYFNTAIKNGTAYYWASEQEEGVLKWDMENHSITQFKAGTQKNAGLLENHIRNIKRDKEGYLWILSDVTLSKFDPVKDTVVEVLYVNSEKNTPNASLYFDMYDDGNTLWFASYGAGVCGYSKQNKKWNFINEQNGLCNNSVYGILPESDSVFWASTNMGLSRINHFTKSCSNYYYEDGLQDNSFDEKGALAANGKLYFGGVNGFTEVDPKKIKTNPFDFPVYITRVVYFANNTNTEIRNLVWENITLPSGTSKITISLAALTFNTNHKIKFSYKIEGIQNNFTEVEDNNLTLNTLDYGRYKIIFRYRKEDGSYVNDALTLSVYITPRWYQTWWFTTLLFLLASVILYALYRYRIGQIHKQQEIRKSIARDLHDDLGSTLNSVKIFTNLAISGVKQNESLLQIKNNLTEAITGLRDMIWVLDDSLDTAEELVVRLKQFAMPVTTASNMEFIVKTGSGVNSYTLTKEEKRNLFLICKEAINNSIKYSGASKITLDIIPAGKKIQITVTDNGKGFDEVTVKKGYGLKNMQYRANQINYKLGLTSAPEIGTQINLLPA